MATYYALTTTGQSWYPLAATGGDKTAVEQLARTIIGDMRTAYGTDIYLETEHKNLRVVPKSRLRAYGLSPERIDDLLAGAE